MTNSSDETGTDERLTALALTVWLLWQPVRLPALTLLVILEPIVRFVLSVSALLVLLTALFFKATLDRPDFPFWGMVAGALGCVLLLSLYYGVMRLLR